MRPRRLLAVVVSAALGAAVIAGGAMAAGGHSGSQASSKSTPLPVKAMERALHATGTVTGENLNVGIDRTRHHRRPHRQGADQACLRDQRRVRLPASRKERRVHERGHRAQAERDQPFIDAVLRNGLTFQAEHQHMYDFKPMVWFIHIRGKGNAVGLAKRAHNALAATATPLPQAPPPHPHTSLQPKRLEKMLHGFDVEVGDSGVVTVYVARRNPVYIDGIRVNQATNIATNIAFEPLNKKGTRAAVMPDFGMNGEEINPVVRTMRKMGWDIGCLYNQETEEHPQLYFSHEFKVGNPYKMAAEVRKGLNQMNVQ